MASGKTLRLIDMLRRAEIAGKNVKLFKHKIDVRDGEDLCASRFGLKWDATAVTCPDAIQDIFINHKDEINVVGIEEGQFFRQGLPQVVRYLLEADVDVIVTGLNQDYRGEPFGCMPYLMAMADDLELLTAVCSKCGRAATRTFRLVESSELVLVGGDESYEPRCPECWKRPL